jgi:hypothetical protein
MSLLTHLHVRWVDYEYGEDVVGALTVVTRYEGEAEWSVVGKGTEAESLGVSGSMVSLSGDGRIAAIGYDTVRDSVSCL